MLLAGTKVQIQAKRFLRPRYSVYWLYWYESTNTHAGGAAERVRSAHSSSDLALDRDPSTELAQEPLPLQPLALHVTLSALAARKLSGLVVQKCSLPGTKVQTLTWPLAHSVQGEQDETDSRRTSSNTSGGETPGKFESPCNTLPLQTRSSAPDAKRHRGSSSASSDKEVIGLSFDKEGGSDALVLHAQVEEQQQQVRQQVSSSSASFTTMQYLIY
jgi:hypothetical protein